MPKFTDRQSPNGPLRPQKTPKPTKTASRAKAKRARAPLVARLGRWLRGLRWWGRGQTSKARQRRLHQLLLGPVALPATQAQWRELRQRNMRQAKVLMGANKPLRAVQLLTRAQMVDPDHAPYNALLIKAIELREQRRGGKGRSGLMDQAQGPLRQQVLELEAFIATVEEIEHLVERAGYPPLKRSVEPRTATVRAKGKRKRDQDRERDRAAKDEIKP